MKIGEMYKVKNDIANSDGKVVFKKGEIIFVHTICDDGVYFVNEIDKNKTMLGKADIKNNLSLSSLNLKNGEMYFMYFNSGYRTYFAFGTDINAMAKKILARYNNFCEHNSTFSEMSKIDDGEYAFWLYKVPLDFDFDDEYIENQNCLSEKNFIGNYLDKYRKPKNRWSYFFHKPKLWKKAK